ncbi:MAG: CaiB/BaiF CoA-transferase family protein [Gammaproteobacteria bacterium]|jgi:crotonobetainyl-CoA:carnitine CoA-transferase CaiB-like acyl-CoA transferase|nr:CaiB/BaiF CoA-transferase family protein [Gammaproteobacteria bacterium]MDP6616513.1 CaiB/BaiF CoA-transferase family protein [Gammaproteobacteria bacterium]MDP6694238.1 CaiB/BaiF CoA-transferase family protein [Gammaproteobacteria bacterium]
MNNNNGPQGPLHGIRVLELGQLIAGPYTGSFLGYFGAEIIKVEQPGCGDPLRTWRMMDGDTSVWWASIARNKKSITANLRTKEGSDIVRRLAAECDVLIENFRPGAMEKWDLGPDELRKDNPGLIYARVSGYGQDGPYSSRLGFASVCEGFGGFRYLNGFPDRPPVRPNLSMGDTLAALHTALGIVMACVRKLNDPEKRGQVIDVAIYEAVYSMLESVVPEYDRGGVVRECSGSTLTGIVPTNTYRCSDGKDVIIGANGDSIFKRLCIAMGRPEMGDDPRFASNNDRVEHEPEIDAVIEAWMKTMTGDEALKVLEEAQVPSGPIYSVADMLVDEQYNARGMFETVESNGKPLKVPAMIPKMSETPGTTRTTAPSLGAHTEEVLGSLLGMSAEEIAKLKDAGAI